MRCLGILAWTVVFAAGPGKPAAASPLLVVVESTDHAAPDPEAVRRSIQAELGTSVIAPASDQQAPTDLLVVSIDRSHIRMSLRTSTTAVVTRTIDAPADRGTRARQIAWLAGNLARDQVGPLITTEAVAERPVRREVAAQETPAERFPPAANAPVQPGPMETPSPPLASTSPRPVEVASAVAATTPPDSAPRWSISAAGGATIGASLRAKLLADGIGPFEPTYQLEVARQTGPSGLILGAALDMGSSTSNRLMGVAGFAGTSRRYRRWLFEATAGAGVELVRTLEPVYSISAMGVSSSEESTIRPALQLRGAGNIGFALSSNIDLLIGVIVHVTTAGFDSDFAGATAGLRYRLP